MESFLLYESTIERKKKELHDKVIAIQLRGLDTFIFVFQKTADGETYYVDCTPEENRECHIHTAETILEAIKAIKKMDSHVYNILKYRYEDELKECEELVRA